LHDQAKFIVLYCTKRNRMGDSRCTPLVDALELRLKELVGESHWRFAETETQRYFGSAEISLYEANLQKVSHYSHSSFA
jgi:hypothetical protein